MQTGPLGESGPTVSRIGLGLAALGRPGYINLGHADDVAADYEVATMETRAHAVLDAAWEAGVRYFDAARSYGRAEAFLARWLQCRRIPPDAVTIGSKWGYTYTAEWRVRAACHEVKEHSLATLFRQIGESKDLLGDHLDLYQIHSATLESGVLTNREVLEELARLRGRGMKIGLTLTGPRQADTLRRALDVTVSGDRLFDFVQATWNLLEQSAGPALQEANAAGLGVIIKEALANGRLTERNDDPSFAPKRRLLRDAADRMDMTTDALALAVVLAQPWADVVLSGAATVEHLRSNLAGQGAPWSADMKHLLDAIEEAPADYWATRAGLPWN